MHWARIGEAGFVGGMKFMFALYRLCGRWPFRLALYPVLAWYVLTRAVARRASRDYLRGCICTAMAARHGPAC